MFIDLTNLKITDLPDNLSDDGDFFCSENKLTTLVGSPKRLSGIFTCSENLLKNLIGGPEHVGMSFNCSSNRITSLIGCPKYIGSNFWCRNNPDLIDVSDSWDTEIGGDFISDLNKNMAILPLIKFSNFFNIDKIDNMMAKNKGSSKQNIIDFQFDLIELGFEENAKWKP